MSHFEHPKPLLRHKPTIDPDGTATCVCGWSRRARSQPAAVRAYVSHLNDEKAKEGA